jgi:AraC family transcriptional regulator of adaptative response / DNA-3-methyladenine glycosylase II
LRKLVQAYGPPIPTCIPGLTHIFPGPNILANANLGAVGIPFPKAAAINAFARMVATGHITFEAQTSLEDTVKRIRSVAGTSDMTAQYIAMRAFGEPDAFPVPDAVLNGMLKPDPKQKAPELSQIIGAWRPWRGYAAMAIWTTHE